MGRRFFKHGSPYVVFFDLGSPHICWTSAFILRCRSRLAVKRLLPCYFCCFWFRSSFLRFRRSPHAVLHASCMLRLCGSLRRCVDVWRVIWWVVHTYAYGGLSVVLFVLSLFPSCSFCLSPSFSFVGPQPLRANRTIQRLYHWDSRAECHGLFDGDRNSYAVSSGIWAICCRLLLA